MSENLLTEIKNQLKQSRYQIVHDTRNRLRSLDLDSSQINHYLNWAYSNALLETGELDEEKYFQNLNQLPLTSDLDEPQKMVKSLSIDEALRLLSELLYQQTSSLQEVRIDYWYGHLIMDDGFEMDVRILSKVRPIELAEVLAMREGIEQMENVEIVLRSNSSPIILNDFQKDEALEDLIETKDVLEFYFRDEDNKIVIEFDEKSSQVFHAIESVSNY